MPFLRKPAVEPLAISMCGLRLGHRVLVIGASDQELVWRLAGKVGLTGRTCMIDESAAQLAAASTAVEKQGALIEGFAAPFTSLPFEKDAFDVVVMRNAIATIDPARRGTAMREVARVVRPGGRCVDIEDAPPSGVWARLTGRAGATPPPGPLAVEQLTAAGFRGVRLLAEREGVAFVEGVKAARRSD